MAQTTAPTPVVKPVSQNTAPTKPVAQTTAPTPVVKPVPQTTASVPVPENTAPAAEAAPADSMPEPFESPMPDGEAPAEKEESKE